MFVLASNINEKHEIRINNIHEGKVIDSGIYTARSVLRSIINGNRIKNTCIIKEYIEENGLEWVSKTVGNIEEIASLIEGIGGVSLRIVDLSHMRKDDRISAGVEKYLKDIYDYEKVIMPKSDYFYLHPSEVEEVNSKNTVTYEIPRETRKVYIVGNSCKGMKGSVIYNIKGSIEIVGVGGDVERHIHGIGYGKSPISAVGINIMAKQGEDIKIRDISVRNIHIKAEEINEECFKEVTAKTLKLDVRRVKNGAFIHLMVEKLRFSSRLERINMLRNDSIVIYGLEVDFRNTRVRCIGGDVIDGILLNSKERKKQYKRGRILTGDIEVYIPEQRGMTRVKEVVVSKDAVVHFRGADEGIELGSVVVVREEGGNKIDGGIVKEVKKERYMSITENAISNRDLKAIALKGPSNFETIGKGKAIDGDRVFIEEIEKRVHGKRATNIVSIKHCKDRGKLLDSIVKRDTSEISVEMKANIINGIERVKKTGFKIEDGKLEEALRTFLDLMSTMRNKKSGNILDLIEIGDNIIIDKNFCVTNNSTTVSGIGILGYEEEIRDMVVHKNVWIIGETESYAICPDTGIVIRVVPCKRSMEGQYGDMKEGIVTNVYQEIKKIF